MSLDVKIEKDSDWQKSEAQDATEMYWSRDLLDKYLSKAVKITKNKSLKTSDELLSKEAQNEKWQGIKMDAVKNFQQDTKEEIRKMEKNSPWIKLGFAVGMDSTEGKIVVGALAASAAVAAGVAGGIVPAACIAGYMVADMMRQSACRLVEAADLNRDEPQSGFQDYVDLKHQQLALRHLAKNLVKQETKEKETGKSVQAAVIAKAGCTR